MPNFSRPFFSWTRFALNKLFVCTITQSHQSLLDNQPISTPSYLFFAVITLIIGSSYPKWRMQQWPWLQTAPCPSCWFGPSVSGDKKRQENPSSERGLELLGCCGVRSDEPVGESWLYRHGKGRRQDNGRLRFLTSWHYWMAEWVTQHPTHNMKS